VAPVHGSIAQVRDTSVKDSTEGLYDVQISVCGLELWPEARKCEDDWRLGQGVLFGALLMGWTLYIGI
jgi:ZIP family zinc transporter